MSRYINKNKQKQESYEVVSEQCYVSIEQDTSHLVEVPCKLLRKQNINMLI